MANNTILDPGTGGDTIRDVDRTGVKTQVVGLDLGIGTGAESLMSGSMPVTAASLPLPTGASTSAKQPALGTAGTASADVITVQGIASMTPVKTDGSGVTQPVSGTVTATGPLTDTQLRATAVPVDTELPAAAALADAASNPTTPTLGSAGLVWNGTTWDRLRGDTTNGAFVNVKTSVLPTGASTAAKQPALGTAGAASADVLTVQGVASMTALKVDGSAVTQPVSLAGTQSVNQAQVAGTATDTNSGVKSAGTQRVVLATDQPQLTNALKVDGSAVTQPVSAAVGSPAFVTVTPSSTGGWTPKVFSAAAAAAKTLINGSACTFGGHLTIYNPNASVAYIQVFDAATTAAVTVGTTAATALLIIPATSAANVEVTNGIHMASGIVIAATTTAVGSTGVTTALDGTLLFK